MPLPGKDGCCTLILPGRAVVPCLGMLFRLAMVDSLKVVRPSPIYPDKQDINVIGFLCSAKDIRCHCKAARMCTLTALPKLLKEATPENNMMRWN